MTTEVEHTHVFVTAVFPMVVRESEGIEEKVEQICGTCDTVILHGEPIPIPVRAIISGQMPIVFERKGIEDIAA